MPLLGIKEFGAFGPRRKSFLGHQRKSIEQSDKNFPLPSRLAQWQKPSLLPPLHCQQAQLESLPTLRSVIIVWISSGTSLGRRMNGSSLMANCKHRLASANFVVSS